ncbi:hypothetical protein [Pseudophaeobacter sp.]|uniref:hypothetical protein n=1 Tax=Pseudophaeobacter sp. TaxID=1971739 RepID=UPI0032995836
MTIPVDDVIGAALTTVAADLFTVPVGKVRNILQVQACNVDGTDDVDVTLQWTDATSADAVTRLAYQVAVAAKDARTLLAGPMVLCAGDKLQALASADGDAELTVTFYDEDVV